MTSFLVQNYHRQNVTFVRGEGCYLVDSEGRRYLDAFAGVAVGALGHGHPRLVQAIQEQAGALLHSSNHYFIAGQEELAALLIEQAFPGRVFFCNSGTEANEAAYKVVRLWGNQVHQRRKTRILAFENSFHGRTLGSLSITSNPSYREPFAPLPPAEFLPFGDLSALNSAVADDVAAIFIESIQGEGGVNVAPPGFLSAVRQVCTRQQVLMVVDEVQTGMGRTGRFFSYQHEGIRPDIVTMGKGLAGGVPIGATIFSEQTAALLKPGLHGTTFGGNHLACAAAIAVMREISRPGFIENVAARGEELKRGLRRLFTNGEDVRGKGLLLGVQLKENPQRWLEAARAEGLVVGSSGGNTLRMAPPLIISAAQIDELLSKLAAAKRRLE